MKKKNTTRNENGRFRRYFCPHDMVACLQGQFYSIVVLYLALHRLISVVDGLFRGFVPMPMYIGTIICDIPTESATHSLIGH